MHRRNDVLTNRFSRREFLSAAASATALAFGTQTTRLPADDDAASKLAFFVVGDTHYLADKESPDRMDTRSAEICGRLVDTLNALSGSMIPEAAGGGTVAQVAGVIHTGDIIDTGDKNGAVHAAMQKTEFAAYAEDYGLTGTEGRLKLPVFEVYGNHDSPHGQGHMIEQLAARNRQRSDLIHLSANGLHFSWDWGPVHFVNLGLIVGADKSMDRKRRYAAMDSLEFLKRDLQEYVGDRRRPLVITHHIDIGRYAGNCSVDEPAGSKEWDPCDVQAFYKAIKDFNVAGIFYGHTHARNVFRWDGKSTRAQQGLDVFNADNGSHFGSDNQAFFYVEMNSGKMTVREYQTKDGWRTGFFTPQRWVTKAG